MDPSDEWWESSELFQSRSVEEPGLGEACGEEEDPLLCEEWRRAGSEEDRCSPKATSLDDAEDEDATSGEAEVVEK